MARGSFPRVGSPKLDALAAYYSKTSFFAKQYRDQTKWLFENVPLNITLNFCR